jgi:hypothetical protein
VDLEELSTRAAAWTNEGKKRGAARWVKALHRWRAPIRKR